MYRFIPVHVCLTACSDAGITEFNTEPTAEISSRADGRTFLQYTPPLPRLHAHPTPPLEPPCTTASPPHPPSVP